MDGFLDAVGKSLLSIHVKAIDGPLLFYRTLGTDKHYDVGFIKTLPTMLSSVSRHCNSVRTIQVHSDFCFGAEVDASESELDTKLKEHEELKLEVIKHGKLALESVGKFCCEKPNADITSLKEQLQLWVTDASKVDQDVDDVAHPKSCVRTGKTDD